MHDVWTTREMLKRATRHILPKVQQPCHLNSVSLIRINFSNRHRTQIEDMSIFFAISQTFTFWLRQVLKLASSYIHITSKSGLIYICYTFALFTAYGNYLLLFRWLRKQEVRILCCLREQRKKRSSVRLSPFLHKSEYTSKFAFLVIIFFLLGGSFCKAKTPSFQCFFFMVSLRLL